MSKSIVALLLLTTGGLAHAATPTSPAKQVERYTHYFSRAGAAVKAGAIAPYGIRKTVGLGAHLFGGAELAVGTQTVVDRGMTQRYLLGSVRPSIGASFGGGPTYFARGLVAKAGEPASTILPRAAQIDLAVHSFVVGGRAGMRDREDLKPGIDVLSVGADLGTTFTAKMRYGAKSPSRMLSAIEEGTGLARATANDLARGESAGAQAKIARMKLLHLVVRDEKRAINKTR